MSYNPNVEACYQKILDTLRLNGGQMTLQALQKAVGEQYTTTLRRVQRLAERGWVWTEYATVDKYRRIVVYAMPQV